jgi:tryptophan-rich sensory protein
VTPGAPAAPRRWPWPWLVSSAAAVVLAIAGAAITDLGPWYQALRVPPWKPPDAAFGPIWTVVFTGAVIAAARAWRASVSGRRALVALWTANATLNFGWSVLFFYLHRPDLAYVEVFALWLSVAALAAYSWRRDRVATLALVPYLVWVSIAASLNGAIVALNPR